MTRRNTSKLSGRVATNVALDGTRINRLEQNREMACFSEGCKQTLGHDEGVHLTGDEKRVYTPSRLRRMLRKGRTN